MQSGGMDRVTLHGWLMLVLTLLSLGVSEESRAAVKANSDVKSGESLYGFYCYQCHAYSGTADTLAATYLAPEPRDFTKADPLELSRERMIRTVTDGRPGTAMVSFANVIDAAGIERLVDFIRVEFMTDRREIRRYHTVENGWPDHERYAAAFPFATGEIALGVEWGNLSPEQQSGRTLYLGACISCHDYGARAKDALTWDLRPLSYPRDHYSHSAEHMITGASPYAIHDVRPQHGKLTPAQARGQTLYEANCAFCHAKDGTGRNWIGRFMEPHPRNLSDEAIAQLDKRVLLAVVQEGLPGTSMPSWRATLADSEILDIIEYVTGVLARTIPLATTRAPSNGAPSQLVWQPQSR